MDRKSIAVLVASFIVLVAWFPLMNLIYPPKPLPATNTFAQTLIGTNRAPSLFATTNPEPATVAPARPASAAPTPAIAAKPIADRPEAPEEIVLIENENARYFFTSHGGGLKLVELKKYPADVGRRKDKSLTTNGLATLNTGAPRAVLELVGAESMQGDGIYTLTKTTNGLRAEKVLTNGLALVKDFQLSTNFLIEASVRLENRGPEKLTLPPQTWIMGASTPIGPRDNNTLMLGAMEYNGTKAEVIGDAWFANRSFGCIPGTPRSEYLSGSRVVWGAVYNQFFALAVIPKEAGFEMSVQKLDLPAPTFEERAADPKLVAKPAGFEAALRYPFAGLEPKQTLERHYFIYAGPKEYNGLARIGAAFGNNLDSIMNFGVFGIVAKLLLLSMNGLHAMHLGYGWAIVVITIIIKSVLWPLTTASTRSMKRMSALQPQMKALQEKYKDDPKKMNLKLMEFMKENKVSPLNGCFPMLLQIPVFMGFYTMLQSAIELRGASFLWAKDLSAADTVWFIPGFNFPVNPLPLLMGVTMLWQASMTPPSPGMDPTQQKIMKYMPLMFMVFLYNFSAGLTLYWTVQNLLSIAQMKLTRNDNLALAPARKHSGPAPGAFGARKK